MVVSNRDIVAVAMESTVQVKEILNTQLQNLISKIYKGREMHMLEESKLATVRLVWQVVGDKP